MLVEWSKARELITDADVLLFRAEKFPTIGWWIGKYTKSIYSHVGLAHWKDTKLYCVEFRELIGSRTYPLEQYIKDGAQIDVFRPTQTIVYPHYNNITNSVELKEYKFTPAIAQNITHTALNLVGKPYGYRLIWHIFKTYIPFVRLRSNITKNGEPKKFVCSTLVTYTYRKHFIDPVPFLSDEYTTPGDLARSDLFSYLFSIKN